MSKTKETKELTPVQQQEQALDAALAKAPDIPDDLADAGVEEMADKANTQLPQLLIMHDDANLERFDVCEGALGAMYMKHGSGDDAAFELFALPLQEHALEICFLAHWKCFEKWRDMKDGEKGPICKEREVESFHGPSELRELCLKFGDSKVPYSDGSSLKYDHHHMHYFFGEIQSGQKEGRLVLIGMRGGGIKCAKRIIRQFREIRARKEKMPLMGVKFLLYTERHAPNESGKKPYWRWWSDVNLKDLTTPIETVRRLKDMAEELDSIFQLYGAHPQNPIEEAEVVE